jgi:CDP-diacylglycerol--glycerol-3-phosphate 3-phosphatidyltransferase
MVPLYVPNVLTVIRILLVPVLWWSAGKDQRGRPAGGDRVRRASLTDANDGYLARSRNWVTTFGKLMDPIAVAMVLALIAFPDRPGWPGRLEPELVSGGAPETGPSPRLSRTRPPARW